MEKILGCLPEGTTKTLSRETTFQDLGFDSLDFLEFIVQVETAFQTSIPNGPVMRFKTLGDVADWIETHGS